MNKFARALVAAAALALVCASPAVAHHDTVLTSDSTVNSGKEIHAEQQHGQNEGHLPGSSSNVTKVGHIDLVPDDQQGRIADVGVLGNYAYLGKFWEPECETGGVYIVDIADPENPKKAGFIPSHNDTYQGEGIQAKRISTKYFNGDLLLYNNEICETHGTENGVGGISLIDVSNPRKWKKLVEGYGDFTVKGKSQRHANESHSAFMWENNQGTSTHADDKAYVVMIDNEETEDIDILDITNPSRPEKVSETDLVEETGQEVPENLESIFSHDMVVKKIDGHWYLLVCYWDGGYAILNVDDPAHPVYLRDTDYPMVDPFAELLSPPAPGVSPEGNGHQAEFTRGNDWFIATDEDFDPYRVTAQITEAPYAGHEFTAVNGDNTPPIDNDTSLVGDTRFVGLACGALPAADATHKIAVIERGVCDFQVKLENIDAAGYEGGIVFNRTGVDGCETLVTMIASGDIPFVFASRTDGLRILGQDLTGYTCSTDGSGTAAPAAGIDGLNIDMSAFFDGWGYTHLYDAQTMAEVDNYAIPESLDSAFAQNHGDLSVHEVATDPDTNLAYLSYYAGGFRVLEYGVGGLNEVGHYIAPGGSNLWGVQVWKHEGEKYVLASDRDSGLWIFQYTPED